MGTKHDPGRMSVADFDAPFAELDNSGRWGDDDALGTLNLLAPEHVVAAAATARPCPARWTASPIPSTP